MANLQDIVRKRRSSLVEGDRRQFSVARVEAVRKMRKFALEDPRYYLLELIQSAVANGTGFISIDLFRIETDRDDLKMRWTGSGFSRIEMLNLFDVLLEAEGDGGRADIQMFARAINAMLVFEPDRLLLASGGRDREGVTCEIRGDGSEIVELRNASDFDGVHVFASGMKGSRLPKWKDADQRMRYAEKKLIQERCVMPDVSVMFNGREVSHITWTLHDRQVYPEDVIHIDEDDLYGELWPSPGKKQSYFDLMTWGVKIDRVRNEIGPFRGVSGAVVFNKLKKTADHAKIVRDENFDRLWARLRPYAEMLGGMRDKIGYDVALPGTGGAPLAPDALLEELAGVERVLMIDPDVDSMRSDREVAHGVADALNARLLVAEPDQDALVRLLSDDDVEVVRTDFTEDEIRFFRSEPVGPPPRPWLVEAAEPQTIPVEDFADELIRASGLGQDAASTLREAIGVHGRIHTRVYTPEALGDGDESLQRRWVRVLTCEREVWAGGVETAFPGHILYVDVPPAPPSRLRTKIKLPGGGAKTVATLVGEHAVREARDELEWATKNALAALGRTKVPAGSHASRIALHALGRQTILSLSHETGELGFSILAAEPDRALLSVPLFEDAAGRTVDGEDVERRLGEGLLPIAREVGAVDFDACDVSPEDVLVLDDEQERLLVHIVGGDATVRLDADVRLSNAVEPPVTGTGFVPLDAPFGRPMDELTPAEQRAICRDLVGHVRGGHQDGHAQERQRRARRILVAYLLWCERSGEQPALESLGDMRLVDASEGAAVTVRRLWSAIAERGRVVMSDGRSTDVVREPSDAPATDDGRLELEMNPHLARLLRKLDAVQGPADATVVDGAGDEATVDRVAVESSTMRGYLAVPTQRLSDPVVTVVDRGSGEVRALRREAERFGVVGTLAADTDGVHGFPLEQARHQIEQHARILLEEQMGKMSGSPESIRERRLELLLSYAGKFLRIMADDQGRVDFDVLDELAFRILELPLFPTDRGVPVSGVRLLREFARSQTVGESLFLRLSSNAPRPVVEWAQRHLDPSTIYREPRRELPTIEVDPGQSLFGQLRSVFESLGLGARADGEVELRRWPHDREHLIRLYGFNRGISQQFATQRRLFVLVEGEDVSAATLVTGHPLLERLDSLDARERLSWLMLSAYSCINEARVEVLNEHELAFQRRLARHLLDADLDVTRLSTGDDD
jgi:hypothetical protein